MSKLKVNIEQVIDFIKHNKIAHFQQSIKGIYQSLYNKTGIGNDFMGWVSLPSGFPDEIIDQIRNTAKEIRDRADILVVVGIGGSYLGTRAIIEALSDPFACLYKKRKSPLIIYAGHNIGEKYLTNLLEILDDYNYALCVISKSGTTTEPAIAFRFLKSHIEKKYSKEEARKRTIIITDKNKGALRELADKEDYTSFTIPDDIGGRYSVLTAVGLLPIAVAGFDIKKLLMGAAGLEKFLKENIENFENNPVSLYAATRNALYQANKNIEILVNYEPELFYLSEWWKQLYGESEGKNHKGIFPAAVNFTTDLHSLGQYIQDGRRNLFETVISVENSRSNLPIPEDIENLDNLNYLTGRTVREVNKTARLGTMLAHVEGGVPNIRVSIPEVNEEMLGQLIYFFEMACAVSGYLLGVNPFDQPGVENYKNNMFALLGKPGFENETIRIQKIQ